MNKLDKLIKILRMPVFFLPQQLAQVYQNLDDSYKFDYLRIVLTNISVYQYEDKKIAEKFYSSDLVQQLGSLYIIAPVIPSWADDYYIIVVENYLKEIRSSLPLDYIPETTREVLKIISNANVTDDLHNLYIRPEEYYRFIWYLLKRGFLRIVSY